MTAPDLPTPAPTPPGGRVQLAVDDLDTAVDFYTRLLGCAPTFGPHPSSTPAPEASCC